MRAVEANALTSQKGRHVAEQTWMPFVGEKRV